MADQSVAIVGGAVAGLAAAERFREFADVTLFERQPYENRRVNCGEAINDTTLIPLDKTTEMDSSMILMDSSSTSTGTLTTNRNRVRRVSLCFPAIPGISVTATQ